VVAICLSCGCVPAGTGTPDDDHGDGRNITLTDLAAAALAGGGLTIPQASGNVVTSVAMAAADCADSMVFKAASPSEQRYVLGIAYQAGPDPRIAKGADGGRDFFTPAELEKAAWSFLRNGPQVGLFHVDGTEGAAQVVESYIYRGPDWDLGDGLVAKSGDWLVGAILDDRAWQLHKAGRLNGWSPQGTARRRRVTQRQAA